MTGIEIYLSHHDLLDHYLDGSWGGRILVFSKDFRESFLPLSGDGEGFDLEILDTSDDKSYTHKMYVAYDNLTALDSDYKTVENLMSLQSYFYGSHHCPCHRKDYAKAAGAIVERTESEKYADDNGGRDGGYCSGNRFLIKSITCPSLPGLILYSETMSQEELEELPISTTHSKP